MSVLVVLRRLRPIDAVITIRRIVYHLSSDDHYIVLHLKLKLLLVLHHESACIPLHRNGVLLITHRSR